MKKIQKNKTKQIKHKKVTEVRQVHLLPIYQEYWTFGTHSIRPDIPVWDSGYFMWRMKQYFPVGWTNPSQVLTLKVSHQNTKQTKRKPTTGSLPFWLQKPEDQNHVGFDFPARRNWERTGMVEWNGIFRNFRSTSRGTYYVLFHDLGQWGRSKKRVGD